MLTCRHTGTARAYPAAPSGRPAAQGPPAAPRT